MQLDIGEVRFLTKVAEKSPRGLRLLLFKEKATGKEKLVFVVKTASEDIEKLALSKMTWQIEQSKVAPRVVIVRLLILPEGSNEFFQSETGLIMNEQKDRRSLEALGTQKSIEIYFFTYEAEFHSKIELMTTYNMSLSAKAALEKNPIVDESKLIVKSENFSESDIKNALTGKIGSGLKDKDLADSIQKKMPTISSSVPKAKPAEFSKTSIKSNDMVSSGKGSATIPPPSKKTGLTPDELKRATASSASKITSDDLMRTIPPDSIKKEKPVPKKGPAPQAQEMDELMKAFDVFGGTPITSDELMKTIPPDSIKKEKPVPKKETAPESQEMDELMKAFDIFGSEPTKALTPEELLKSLNESEPAPSESNLKAEDLLKSLNFSEKGIPSGLSEGSLKPEDLIDTLEIKPKTSQDSLNKDNLMSVMNSDDSNLPFLDMVPTVDISKQKPISEQKDSLILKNEPTRELKFNQTVELKRDELLEALRSEPSPLKLTPEKEIELINDLKSEPSPLKEKEGMESDLMKKIDAEIKIVTPVSNTIPPVPKTQPPPPVPEKKEEISEDDLLKALLGEI